MESLQKTLILQIAAHWSAAVSFFLNHPKPRNPAIKSYGLLNETMTAKTVAY